MHLLAVTNQIEAGERVQDSAKLIDEFDPDLESVIEVTDSFDYKYPINRDDFRATLEPARRQLEKMYARHQESVHRGNLEQLLFPET